MKKAFVIGANGFLGINLVKQLVELEWEVTAFHLPDDDLKHLAPLKVQFAAGNILDYESIVKAIPDSGNIVVFHLAGDTTMWPKLAKRQDEINIQGTANVCRAALEKGIVRLIYTSSSSAFGYHDSRLNESTVSNALSCGMNYNRSKYLAEKEIHKAVRNGLDAVILNPCNMIGPFDSRGWATLVINASKKSLIAVSTGKGTFAHVKDVASAHIAAVDSGVRGQNYFLGGREISFQDVFKEIENILEKKLSIKIISPYLLKLGMRMMCLKSFFTGKEPLLTYPKYKRLIGHLRCDDSKAKNELGFKTTTIREMLYDSSQWLKSEGLI